MLLALLGGCTAPKESAPNDTSPPFSGVLPDISARGVLVLHVDTLRADHLTLYGYPRDTTPHLERRPWRVVHGVRATTSWTMPSTASFLTSLDPERHGLRHWSFGSPNGEMAGTPWAAHLGASGWATGLFTGNTFASEQSWLDVGFDVSVLHQKVTTGQENLPVLAEDFLAWLDGLPASTPFFAHLQPMEMHNAYAPSASDLARFRDTPIPFARTQYNGYDEPGFTDAWNAASEEDRPAVEQAVVDIYDASLAGLDRDIDALLDALDTRGLLDETLVVLTSDHGQTLNETGDGTYGHQFGWREELVRLPLIFLHPDVPAGEVDCLSSNVDVLPTIAAALGVAPLEGIDGVDLAAGCRTTTKGSLWGTNGKLDTVGAASEEGALKLACRGGVLGGTAVGEGADPLEATPPEDVPGGDALADGIAAHVADISALVADTECPR